MEVCEKKNRNNGWIRVIILIALGVLIAIGGALRTEAAPLEYKVAKLHNVNPGNYDRVDTFCYSTDQPEKVKALCYKTDASSEIYTFVLYSYENIKIRAGSNTTNYYNDGTQENVSDSYFDIQSIPFNLNDGTTVYYFTYSKLNAGYDSFWERDIEYWCDVYYYNSDSAYEALKYILNNNLEPDEKYYEPLPDINDIEKSASYGFKNFSADNVINAKWDGYYYSGISEHVGIHVSVLYAAEETGYNIITDEVVCPNDFEITDNGFFIDWDSLVHDNPDYYIRSIYVVPIGLNDSGEYVVGDGVSVLYNQDGKVNEHSAFQNVIDSDRIMSGGSDRYGTIYLNDFYLKNVIFKKGVLGGKDVVQWEGCTNNIDYLVVPDSDTLVICTVILYDSNGDVYVEAYDECTIGSGSMKIDWNGLYEKYKESEYLWTGELRFCPVYKQGNALYIGEQTAINIFNQEVRNEGIDEDGNFIIEDVTTSNIEDSGKDSIFDNAADFINDSEAISKYISVFFGFLSNLVSMMGQVPQLFAQVFSFLPSIYIDLIGVLFVLALVCRILGR